MRTGGFVVSQHALSDESASIIKQAITLAKQRGHAQVTPLHVATTMLITSSSASSLSSSLSSSSSSSSSSSPSSPSALLRKACLQTLPQPHPFQSKALDLCFNVALNRLPAATPSSHHQRKNPPSISNALVAAFKRAQAHQRRGSTDSLHQQQSLLAMKIELDQLIISILDDPSVSRVLKEAGFSSSHVKTNVEEALASMETISSQSTSVITTGGLMESKAILSNTSYRVRDEDIACVIESLMDGRKRGIVVVGEKIEVCECVIKGVMDKLMNEDSDQDHQIPGSLRGLKFLDVSFYSFEHLSREKMEKQLEDVKSQMKTYMNEGVVLYLGDLKWIADYRANNNYGVVDGRNYCYCPIEHITMELGNFGEIDNGRVWLLGIATFQSYMRCKIGYPSLETVWRLHPLPVPAGSFSLSLTTDSDQENQIQPDTSCSHGNQSKSVLEISDGQSTLPTWLQHHKHDHNKAQSHDGNGIGDVDDDEEVMIINPGQRSLWHPNPNYSSTLILSDDDMVDVDYVRRFKEFNAQNLKILCDALENKVPRYKHVVPNIAATILQCRSGMRKRGKNEPNKPYIFNDVPLETKYETWFLFQGCDMETKENIGRELAKVIFGSHTNFINIGWHRPRHGRDMMVRDSSLINFHGYDESIEEQGRIKKLKFDIRNLPCTNRFVEALRINPHRVFLLEDVDKMEISCQRILERAIARGRLEDSQGNQVGLNDAIIIITRSSSPPPLPPLGHKLDLVQKETNRFGVSLDLNISDINGGCAGIGLLESVDRCITFNI